MNEILLSDQYILVSNTVNADTRFGRKFFAPEVGFGQIEEIELDDGYPATAVTFADIECKPYINLAAREVGGDLVPGERAAVVRAITVAIANRNQTKLFA